MKMFDFTGLDENEANLILTCLGKAPFETVFVLMQKLMKQAQEQNESYNNGTE